MYYIGLIACPMQSTCIDDFQTCIIAITLNQTTSMVTMRGITNLILARWRYRYKSYPVGALQWAALTTEAKTNVGRCVAYPNAMILEDTNSPVR